MSFFDIISSLIFAYTRPFIKWFLRQFTRLCELQRICYGSERGAKRIKGVESSLDHSRQDAIKSIIEELDDHVKSKTSFDSFRSEIIPRAVSLILVVKEIKPKCHPNFPRMLGDSLETIWSYRRLCATIEEIRATSFDCYNVEHEVKLLKLWDLLMPGQELESRVTKQWQDIGFQGDDPMSDFRGMGLLGLENLIFFADEYNDTARHALSHSLHPRHGYTFAIVGINLTSMAYNLMKKGTAKTHLYNLTTSNLEVRHFHKLYCYLFYEFDKYWMECRPTSLMDFSRIYEKFLSNINDKLADNRTILKINLLINNL